jgi:predicted dehydrogenase
MNQPPTPPEPATPANSLTRRKFLRSGAAAGSGLYLVTSKNALSQMPSDAINVGFVGCGEQGKALTDSIMPDVKAVGMNIVAACDIWSYNRDHYANGLRKRGFDVTDYVEIEEMLSKQTNLDAVFIATPDYLHAPHTIAALQTPNIKGVYCEKMMSNTIEAARSMVQAQRDTGKLLQIGHQRRSNPRYLHARNQLIHGHKILGRVTGAYAQWNRSVSEPIAVNPKYNLDQATLDRLGYKSMLEFRNWRWFKAFGGGPISDLGAHQIDLFNWVHDMLPVAVVASGGRDYYKEYEFEDNVFAIYEYQQPEGKSRANYQLMTTNGSQGFYEKFMGEYGAISISEVPTVNQAYRESRAPSWDGLAAEGLLRKAGEVYHRVWEQPMPWRPVVEAQSTRWLASAAGGLQNLDARVLASAAVDQWELPVTLDRRPHNPHIRNFVETVRKGGTQSDLNCPVEEGFRTCVTVLHARTAMENGGRYEFKPEDFVA